MSRATWPDPALPCFEEPVPARSNAAPVHDVRTPDRAPYVPTLDELLRVAVDIAPAAGNEAPDRFFGPQADELDLYDPARRRAAIVAVAAACFLIPDDEAAEDGRSPFEQWVRRSPVPPARERSAFRAVARAPWAVWRITSTAPLCVADATDLAPAWRPDGPVNADLADAFVAPEIGRALLAKIVPTDRGWTVALGLVLPDVPPAVLVGAWVAEVVRHAGAPIEAALASHGHILVRRAVTRWWRSGPARATPTVAHRRSA